jgi:L-rhamnose mutarotase
MLAPDAEQEYRYLHQDVWPSVTARLAASNISSFTIFLRDGVLFSYMEYTGSDYAADMAAMAADEATQRWWELTEPLQRRVNSADEGEWWAPMDEVFHFESDQV